MAGKRKQKCTHTICHVNQHITGLPNNITINLSKQIRKKARNMLNRFRYSQKHINSIKCFFFSWAQYTHHLFLVFAISHALEHFPTEPKKTGKIRWILFAFFFFVQMEIICYTNKDEFALLWTLEIWCTSSTELPNLLLFFIWFGFTLYLFGCCFAVDFFQPLVA